MNMIGQIQQEIPESTDGNVVDNLAADDAVVPLSLFTDALLCNRDSMVKIKISALPK